jgi:hypothetical protein
LVASFLINPEDTDGNGTPDRWFRDLNRDGTNDLMVELPSPAESTALDISNGGQVVGGSWLWTPTTPNGTTGNSTDLPLFARRSTTWVRSSAGQRLPANITSPCGGMV